MPQKFLGALLRLLPRNPWSPGTQGMTRRQSGRRGYLELTLNFAINGNLDDLDTHSLATECFAAV